MSGFKWWTVGAVIVVCVCFLALNKEAMPVQIASVTRGRISEYVEERAKTTLPHVYHLSMPLNGRILPITLKAGTAVNKGQLVAQLDRDDLASRVDELKAEIAAIQAAIEVNKYDAIENTALHESKDWIATMAELVKASQKKIEANQQVYNYSLEYQNTLKASGQAVSRIKNCEAQMNTAVAKVDTETAQINYNAMMLLHKIFLLCPTYINQYLKRKVLSGREVEATLRAAQARLAKVKRDLARTHISSPIDGVVLKRYVKNEQVLTAGARLLDIGNLDDLQVTADILSQDAVRINPGDHVDIYGHAFGMKRVRGVVTRVKPEGFTKVSSLGVEQQRVQVIIAFSQDDFKQLKQAGIGLGNDFRVQVRIYTAHENKALKVPRNALFKGQGGCWELFCIDDDKAVLKQVKVGLLNDRFAQIVEGVKENDKVIVAPPVALRNGMAVGSGK